MKEMQIKLADMLEGLDETLPSVMRDIEKLPGWGIRHEVYLRVDQAFQHHDDDDAVGAGEGIGVSLPPVQFPPFISAGKHFVHCSTVSHLLLFGGESGPSPYHYPAEVKNCLLAHADLISIEFTSFSGSYKGTIMKGMWNVMLKELCGAIAFPARCF